MASVFPDLFHLYIRPILEYVPPSATRPSAAWFLTICRSTKARLHAQLPLCYTAQIGPRTWFGVPPRTSCPMRCAHVRLPMRPVDFVRRRQSHCQFGLIMYGDHRPFSPVNVERQMFTPDFPRFMRAMERLTFAGGNPLRNCVTDGVAAAVEVILDFSAASVVRWRRADPSSSLAGPARGWRRHSGFQT